MTTCSHKRNLYRFIWHIEMNNDRWCGLGVFFSPFFSLVFRITEHNELIPKIHFEMYSSKIIPLCGWIDWQYLQHKKKEEARALIVSSIPAKTSCFSLTKPFSVCHIQIGKLTIYFQIEKCSIVSTFIWHSSLYPSEWVFYFSSEFVLINSI